MSIPAGTGMSTTPAGTGVWYNIELSYAATGERELQAAGRVASTEMARA